MGEKSGTSQLKILIEILIRCDIPGISKLENTFISTSSDKSSNLKVDILGPQF